MKIKVRELRSPHDWRAHQGFDSLISDSIDLLVQNERKRDTGSIMVRCIKQWMMLLLLLLLWLCSLSNALNHVKRTRERERESITHCMSTRTTGCFYFIIRHFFFFSFFLLVLLTIDVMLILLNVQCSVLFLSFF